MSFINAISLIRTFFFLCLARIYLIFDQSPPKIDIIIGSNYGKRWDSNAEEFAKYVVSIGDMAAIVSEQSSLNGTLEVSRGSFRAAYCFLCSKAACYTHSLSDVLPHAHWLFKFRSLFDFPKLIFLQHGVIGLKKELSGGIPMATYIRALEKTFDYMIVSSHWEKQVVLKMGVLESKVVITGLPRFDTYFQKPVPKKKVFIFFTWQSAESYFSKVEAVLESDGIKQLKQRGYEICGVQHNMQIDTNRMQFNRNSSADINAHILDSELLITDDSSVAWDFFYLSREVVFFRPSKSWLVDEPYLDGRIFKDLTQFDESIDIFQNKEFPPLPQNIFEFSDDKNSVRVYELINHDKD